MEASVADMADTEVDMEVDTAADSAASPDTGE
jgi:hypothetical protein